MVWEKSQGEFVEVEVVEWVEAIWSPNKSRCKKTKSRPWGKQKVVAQIAHIDGEFMKLTVLKAAVIENIIGSQLRPYKVGMTVTKKRSRFFVEIPSDCTGLRKKFVLSFWRSTATRKIY